MLNDELGAYIDCHCEEDLKDPTWQSKKLPAPAGKGLPALRLQSTLGSPCQGGRLRALPVGNEATAASGR